ncbi:low molecular weight protein-tyrosine-phosphatase [Flavobacterium sp.]|uniref:low molecular weight protein-tyrosine-phosphatase n=1 Tax=Flavobacterium sp. TaxID=239 RepID=UPI0025BDD51F|nr:low molecular weight protein-tyrosine-phosphatase [Flavobacterium sp.]
MNKINVLFVCLGNICRSPMAEGIFKNIVKKEGLEKYFSIDSAGTSRYHIDEDPDHRATGTCAEKNIILNHKGREFVEKDLINQHVILAMDKDNLANIKKLMTPEIKRLESKSEIFLMRDFDPEHAGANVPDPYYGGQEGFYQVFDMLERSSYELLSYIRRKHSI